MDRRTYMVSLAAAGSLTSISGCMNVLADENESPVYSTDVESPEDPLLDHSVSIVEGGYADPETPLTLEVELTNSMDQTVSYHESRRAVFHLDEDEDDRFYLLPEKYNTADYREFDDNHWKAISELTTGLAYMTERLEPGKSTAKNLVLARQRDVNPPESPPEEIKFSTAYQAGKIPEEVSNNDDPISFPDDTKSYSWSFALK